MHVKILVHAFFNVEMSKYGIVNKDYTNIIRIAYYV